MSLRAIALDLDGTLLNACTVACVSNSVIANCMNETLML